MNNNKKTARILSARKIKICELDAESIAFYRRNPCIACEDLLGIKLIDTQKFMLQMSWNAGHVIWCCSRNFGKSFLGAILMLLKAILFENQAIYIVSSVGAQTKQTFEKIEEIALNIGATSNSIRGLKDIVRNETKKTPNNKTGFAHPQESYHVSFYNGSEIMTLNGKPDNNRSHRASLVFFDESAFSTDELIVVCEAFATQDTEFITSVDKNFNVDSLKRKCPTQLIYASSQDSMDKLFYKHYKDFSKHMLAGNRDYFVCDMICETAITTFMEGKKYKSLLKRSKVESALKGNKEKALREYFNQPTMDGGINQIIKWGTIRKNETFFLPELSFSLGSNYALSFDPCRTTDNSILTVMKIKYDKDLGYIGEIVNCMNFLDKASKDGYKLDSNRQLSAIRNNLYKYSESNLAYENINALLIDQGAGGGGTSTYADGLLNNWVDASGRTRKGLIDKKHDIYKGYDEIYPDALDKVRLISPRKYRTQMVQEFIEIMNAGVIKFPYDFKNEIIGIPDGNKEDEKYIPYELSQEEIYALEEIYELKNEITNIYKMSNNDNTAITYAISKEKENQVHDDRFYTIIMLAHYLYELRRGTVIKNEPDEIDEYKNAKHCATSINYN